MPVFSSLRVRLVGTVLLGITPALICLHYYPSPWVGLFVGLLALAAAWIGVEFFIVRQAEILRAAARKLAAGDFQARVAPGIDHSELGQVARAFDELAATLELRGKERDQDEQRLMNRAMQQAALAALGQFALASDDLGVLLNQTVAFIGQTLEVEYCEILELQPGGATLLMRAGAGWREDYVGNLTIASDSDTLAGCTLTSGEPVVIADLSTEKRYKATEHLSAQGVVSAASVAIASPERTYGVLSVYSAKPRIFNGDDVQFLLAIANSIASEVDRLRAHAELQKMADFVRLSPNPAFEISEDGRISYSNEAAFKLAAALNKTQAREILPSNYADIVRACLESGQTVVRQEEIGGHTLSWRFHPVGGGSVAHIYGEDITERLSLEAQVRQSQKIESVGQLASGVAHDFNNMLAIIHGHVGMLLARPNLPPEQIGSLQAVFFAADRAAGLTRQLLMFSRKSVLQAAPLDLREVVSNMLKMLKRLIGESVEVEFKPPAEIPFIQGDTGMLEQVVMNLSINARDAIGGAGKLTISVFAITVSDADTKRHPEARAGSFVCLGIADTGCGMDDATLARIFEPFFTTKEAGKGTGLGLATVHGIVKQHGGWIEVASAVGKGTTFTVFLPASERMATAPRRPEIPGGEVRGGAETVLVVEDEPVLLNLAGVILQDCGYRVVEAGSGVQALEIWERKGAEIDLLVTDIVMPMGITGLQLARELQLRKPKLKVVFTSGYGVGSMDREFIKQTGGTFLQKPYSRYALAKTVRECLDAPSRNVEQKVANERSI
jgi:signal transduction histidine kinase/ActR/RegA family two-component response regulator/HAMP domain-containing protein